ncbi:MAG TPA: cell wall metabolism sensor histidine kinase WalK, partial [Clostridiales bacterium]|nr:cell wall metabolism sensor histidine kinase WalK [Clostridiales bacterium]
MQKKILVVYIILLFMGIALTGFLTLNFVKTSHLKNIEENLISNGKLISAYIEEKSAEASFQSINFLKYAQEYKEQIQSRITFIDKNGVVLGDSEVDSENLSEVENHKNRPEVQEALEGKIGIDKRRSRIAEMDYIYVAVPIRSDNEIYGVTRLAFPLAEMQKLSYQLFQSVWIAAMCGLLVITVLGYRYIDNVIKPIQEITKVAQKFANGNFNQRVHIRSNDELNVLGDTFNMMAEKLNETISNLQDKNTKLQSILASMNE